MPLPPLFTLGANMAQGNMVPTSGQMPPPMQPPPGLMRPQPPAGPQEQQPSLPQTLFGNLEQGISSPLFLGGIGLMTNGAPGLMQGLQTGNELRQLPLERMVKEAQAQKYMREAKEGGFDRYGKTGAVFQGQDGRYYTVQFGGDGSRKVVPMDDGMTPARGTYVVGDEIIDKSTGMPVRNIGSAIAGKAAQEEIGAATGKQTAAAPSDVTAADNALDLISSIRKHPGIDTGTGLSSLGNVIPGTSGYDFQNIVNQSKSGAFLSAIQQLRGMGSLSNAEGDTATKAVNRMNTATSKGEFMAALDDYEKIVKQGRDKASSRMGGGGGAAAPAPAANPLKQKYGLE